MSQESATPEGVAVRRWWYRWPTWSAYAALGWSLVYSGLAFAWWGGLSGFPFGVGDPEAADMGSVLFAVQVDQTAPVVAAICLVGAAVAVAMLRPVGGPVWRGVVLTVAWLLAVVLVLVLPDVRLLQNFAYALMFVFVKVDWLVLNQVVLVIGGLAFALAALGYRRRSRAECMNCGRSESGADQPELLARWGRTATVIAFLMPLPYGITRLAWALGIPLGIDQDPAAQSALARFGEAVLAGLAIGGGVLTLGLIRKWGEIWPGWVPRLAGRRIPVAFPTILGGVVAIVVTVGALAFVRIVVTGDLGLRQVSPNPPTVTGWGAGAPAWLWPFWGIGLGIAVAAYYYRRRGQCRVCGRGTRREIPAERQMRS